MIKIIGLLVFLSGLAHAQVPRLDQLSDLFREYNKRYATGKYVADKTLIKAYNEKQDAMAAAFKQSGGLKKVLFIQNDYEADLNVTLYVLVDENNNLLALYREKSKYYDEEERSFNRFSSLAEVTTGLNFIPLSGTHALIVKGFYMKAESGGTLQFNFLKNFRDKSWGSANMFLQKKNGSWGIYTEQSQLVSTGMVNVWSGFLNGGVKELVLK